MGRETMRPLANITGQGDISGSISVDQITQVYGTGAKETLAVSDVSFEVKSGSFVVLVGPSGCGKSSLLMMMAGLRNMRSGTISIGGKPITDPDPDRVGVVFQEA